MGIISMNNARMADESSAEQTIGEALERIGSDQWLDQVESEEWSVESLGEPDG
jgi:hypothetical protein